MSVTELLADVNIWLFKAMFTVLTTLSAVSIIAFVYAAIERLVVTKSYSGSRATVGIIGLALSLAGLAVAGYAWHQIVGDALPPMSEQAYNSFPWSKYDWQAKAILWGTLLAIALSDFFAFMYLRSERQA